LAFVDIAGKTLHYVHVGQEHEATPIVFLHEGLGSVELWRDFPRHVVEASGHPGLVYSRQGNGWSVPLEGEREPDYMHVEALQVLPRLVDRLVGTPPILVGHSDGASIALIYAGAGHPVAGMVLIAPHVFVEELTSSSIAAARDRFEDSEMAVKMAKYHTDPESTFMGWADIWLDPSFLAWNIEEYLPQVSSPILLIQGDADEFGTTRQLEAIEDAVSGQTRRLLIPDAGHSPHLSHQDEVLTAITGFIGGLD
jgi:pimeloyl-ACP methyl ester carboxylesterase